ncbi:MULTISPECIES: Gfo/Idh/MocA family protein [unclassified Streptomyces]|uniref:Gfo/Idh/MocA family protein n=1 Tax=unclassified Streptomyces TaxID=2593676 RepID=UPI00214D0697|nr:MULTISPECIES: Gfo/Idh/MocA family oxidoreductase [unclassified Streptomyces]MCX5011266.1 Gfo/Idh/MocA family oxidoreductase [Streptomyces sp. NBC_00555]MCX5611753.1 Gfo/Idh/MocA family oxidoreductase [Streptomyces sp. NBC_00047]UUU39574.1 Gfo/Idh/MocA family oxidoreductase [Streptomyces sp. NBC_00162]
MKRLEVALMGAGLIARFHLDAWTTIGASVRVHSTDGRAEELAREFGAKAVGSLEEALDGVDVVDICTPTSTHHAMAMAAITAGAGVVCEKPLASTTAEAEEIVAAAEQAGVRLYPTHNVRFAPAYGRLGELVAAGSVGAGTVARFTVAGYHPRPWSGQASARSGGIVTDQMLHGVDLAQWVFGDVVRVHAYYQGDIAAPAPTGAVGVGTAVLTHASGAISQVVSRWMATPVPPYRLTCHVSGTGGTVLYDSEWPQEVQGFGGSAGDLAHFGETPFVSMIREFAQGFTGGPEPRLGARDGLAAIRITQAAAESAWTGRAVELTVKGAAA